MFHKILCPIDFSVASMRGLTIAVELALHDNAEVCVLHVEPPLAEMPPASRDNGYSQGTAMRSANAVKSLCHIIEDKIPASVHSRPLLVRGLAAEEITRAAREEDSDLIVLTTNGSSGPRENALGSIAAAVILTAPCAVLTVECLSSAPSPGFDLTNKVGQ